MSNEEKSITPATSWCAEHPRIVRGASAVLLIGVGFVAGYFFTRRSDRS